MAIEHRLELGRLRRGFMSSQRACSAGEVTESSEAFGHSYHDTTIGDQATVHLGDVFNYYEAGSEETPILDWLTPLNPTQRYNQACAQFCDGTLRWFFKDSQFLEWRNGSQHRTRSTLWCQGDMGTGKTTLTAQVLEHLHTTGVPRGSLAILYCSYAEWNTQSAENLLGSILVQLYQSAGQGFEIPSDVKAAFWSQSRFWTRKPTLEQAANWLSSKLDSVQEPVYILVDALDELPLRSRQKLLEVLGKMVQRNIRLLVTSRYMPEDEQGNLPECKVIRIWAHQEDLRTLVNARLHGVSTKRFQSIVSLKNARHSSSRTANEDILEQVVHQAQNMFLHASMHMDRIVSCTKLENVYRVLNHFPSDLDSFYDQAWSRATADRGSPRAQRARLILMWLTLAEEPLTIMALGEALVASGVTIKDEPLSEEDVLSSCVGLLRTEQHSTQSQRSTKPLGSKACSNLFTVITFVHPSAYRHFKRRQESVFPHGNDLILAACRQCANREQLREALLPHYELALQYGTSESVAHRIHSLTSNRMSNLALLCSISLICYWEHKSQLALLAVPAFSLAATSLCMFSLRLTIRSLDAYPAAQTLPLYLTRHLHHHLAKAKCTSKVKTASTMAKTRVLCFKSLLTLLWGFLAIIILAVHLRNMESLSPPQ
ncbi:hypothetical protein Q7P37_001005 [Cladosporium fusiforme]